MKFPSVPLRFPFGSPSVMRVKLTSHSVNNLTDSTFPSVPLRFPFGYPSVMQVILNFCTRNGSGEPPQIITHGRPFLELRSGPHFFRKWALAHIGALRKKSLRFRFGYPNVFWSRSFSDNLEWVAMGRFTESWPPEVILTELPLTEA